MPSFADNLKAIMDQNGYSNYKVSKMLGISPSSVANWLSGATEPTERAKRTVAITFGYDPDALVNGELKREEQSGYRLVYDKGKMKVEVLSENRVVSRQTVEEFCQGLINSSSKSSNSGAASDDKMKVHVREPAVEDFPAENFAIDIKSGKFSITEMRYLRDLLNEQLYKAQKQKKDGEQ